jgi:hypothetical protein
VTVPSLVRVNERPVWLPRVVASQWHGPVLSSVAHAGMGAVAVTSQPVLSPFHSAWHCQPLAVHRWMSVATVARTSGAMLPGVLVVVVVVLLVWQAAMARVAVASRAMVARVGMVRVAVWVSWCMVCSGVVGWVRRQRS